MDNLQLVVNKIHGLSQLVHKLADCFQAQKVSSQAAAASSPDPEPKLFYLTTFLKIARNLWLSVAVVNFISKSIPKPLAPNNVLEFLFFITGRSSDVSILSVFCLPRVVIRGSLF